MKPHTYGHMKNGSAHFTTKRAHTYAGGPRFNRWLLKNRLLPFVICLIRKCDHAYLKASFWDFGGLTCPLVTMFTRDHRDTQGDTLGSRDFCS